MSYAWVGPPAVFNGTDPDGGDSGKLLRQLLPHSAVLPVLL